MNEATATPAPSNWIELRNITAAGADLYLYNWIGDPPGSAAALAYVAGLTSGQRLAVHINSPGGHVFGGLGIYNVLAASHAEIVVYVDGLAGSIASVIAMAGDRIIMAANSVLMIHSPRADASGGAAAIQSTADALNMIGANMAEIYQKRSKLPAARVAELMRDDSWLTAAECLAAGLCDEIADASDLAAAAPAFDLSSFRNVPAVLAKPAAAQVDAGAVSMTNAAPAAGTTTAAASTTAPGSVVITSSTIGTNPPEAGTSGGASSSSTGIVMHTEAAMQAAIVAAVNGAHAAARIQHEATLATLATAEASLSTARSDLAVAQTNLASVTAKLTDTAAKLTAAEALSAANLGIRPLNITAPAELPAGTSATAAAAGAAPKAGTPAQHLAHYRTLTGTTRQAYFAENSKAIWAAYDLENAAAR